MKSLTSVIFKNDKRKEKNSRDGFLGKFFSILSFVIVFGTLAIAMIIASIYITRKLNEQLKMKLVIGELANLISSLVVVFFCYTCTKNIIYIIFVFVISLGLNIFGEKIKILIDLLNPKIDWDNEYAMMKQNTNVMYELFYTLLVMLVMVGMGFIITNLYVYFIVMTVVVVIINLLLEKYILKNEKRVFDGLY